MAFPLLKIGNVKLIEFCRVRFYVKTGNLPQKFRDPFLTFSEMRVHSSLSIAKISSFSCHAGLSFLKAADQRYISVTLSEVHLSLIFAYSDCFSRKKKQAYFLVWWNIL